MKTEINKACGLLVALFFLFLSSAYGQEAITKLKVVTEMANVRLKPDIGSVIIHQVPQGKSLESTGKEGEWFLVKIQIEEGQEASGYVHESTVIVTERPPQIPVKAPVKKEEMTEPEKTETEQTEKITEEETKEEPQIQPVSLEPPTRPPSESRLELLLLGGGNYVIGGDLNSGTQGFVDYYRDFHSIGEPFDAKLVHFTYIYGGELSIPIGSNFYLGFGADYYTAEQEGLVELQESPVIEIRTRPKIEALPLRLSISYYPVSSFYIKTGIEYYFAKCEYYYHYREATFWKWWHGTAKAQGSGILGAMGIDLKIAPWLSFTIEATGRFAKISGFKGTHRSNDSIYPEYDEDGTLYYYNTRGIVEESIPLLFIKLRKPSEDVNISDPRRAIIDFSGVSLRAGFKLRF